MWRVEQKITAPAPSMKLFIELKQQIMASLVKWSDAK
jgi:hypothetical protein